MKILSIETTSDTGSIAFFEKDEMKSEYSFKSSDAASVLVGYTDDIMQKNNCRPEELDFIVVSKGPGLWTGIRLGMGFSKGVSAAGAEIYCVDTAGSLFFAIKEFGIPALCLVNAYREKMHVSFFNGRFDYKKEYRFKKLTWSGLYEKCREKHLFLIGPGTEITPNKIKRLKTVDVSAGWLSRPRAGINGLLAIEKIKRNIPSLPLEPFYGK